MNHSSRLAVIGVVGGYVLNVLVYHFAGLQVDRASMLTAISLSVAGFVFTLLSLIGPWKKTSVRFKVLLVLVCVYFAGASAFLW